MDKQDIVAENKTIYQSQASEIFWKNFVAGFGRSLGSVSAYLILMIVIYFSFIAFIMPRLTPYFSMISGFSKSVESLYNLKPNSVQIVPNGLNLQNLLGK